MDAAGDLHSDHDDGQGGVGLLVLPQTRGRWVGAVLLVLLAVVDLVLWGRLFGGGAAAGSRLTAMRSDPSPTDSRPPALLVGDTYAASPGGAASYGYLGLSRLGWRPLLDAEEHTGYLRPETPHPGEESFALRLAARYPTRPDLVVISGGYDDAGQGYWPKDERRAVTTAFARARSTYRDVKIVVVGPIASSDHPDGELLGFRDIIRDAARAAHLPFVDPLAESWLTGHIGANPSGNVTRYLQPDGVHLTPAGAAYVGDRLAGALKALRLTAPGRS